MGTAIVGLGKGWDRNPAPVSDYGALYHGVQGATSRFVTINGGGEAVGPSAQLGKIFTPVIVAEYVKRGGVWIDYCGFPFYYAASSAGAVQTMGQSGWKEFADYLGYGWLRDVQFVPPLSVAIGSNTQDSYQFARGFPLAESLDGVCYSSQTFSVPGGVLGIGGYNGVLAANGWTALFALHIPNGGYYFYGVYVPELGVESHFRGGGTFKPRGIPTAVYTSFIQNVLHGNTGGYQCRPYKIASQPTHTVSPGPTAPVVFHTPHTAHIQTAHTAHSTAHSGSETRLVEEILGGTLILGGATLGAVLIARHRRRR